ncbi:hypothetical protein BURMUCGD1_4725 [Burkholderia multivorans CGD1]|nr:hypothetical protein BURMUCGD1_4725 [Burkholderia multivorans CGD1]
MIREFETNHFISFHIPEPTAESLDPASPETSIRNMMFR